AVAASSFESTTDFIVAAQAPGTTIPPPPVFGTQPANRTGVVGGSATFAFSNTGGAPAAYQWNLNGVPVDQGNTDKYSFSSDFTQFTINSLTTADSGSYVLQLFNAGGIAVSVPAALTVGTGTLPPPSIARQPGSVNVAAGGTAVFSTAAASSLPTLTPT